MRTIAIFIFLLIACPAKATNYYLANASTSPAGNDSNNGTSPSTPWLTPNHALNCGDVITAVASTAYAGSNFHTWGTVTCAAGNNVAWLKCATFDACKITQSNDHAIAVQNNYWGVQGWEVTNSGTNSDCFSIRPPNTSTNIHHIIFANNVANGCGSTGFIAYNNGAASHDYIAIVGNISYDAATNGGECQSGISVYAPVAHDTNSGTHIYVAGNFSWSNLDPNPCAGGTPTDGEGLIFDTWDASQGGPSSPYTQQGVAYNNIFIGNGGRGFEVFNNTAGSTHAKIYAEYNTTWDNELDPNQTGSGLCGEIYIVLAYNATASYNLAATNAATACNSHNLYATYVAGGNGTDTVTTNWLWSASGFYCGVQSPPNGFSCGTNTTGNPNFSNATIPGAPSCGSASSVPNCMATVISNFTPTASGSRAYGYQIPLGYSITDPLFPTWLCTVTLPAGLITMGCGAPPILGSQVAKKVTIGANSSIK